MDETPHLAVGGLKVYSGTFRCGSSRGTHIPHHSSLRTQGFPTVSRSTAVTQELEGGTRYLLAVLEIWGRKHGSAQRL